MRRVIEIGELVEKLVETEQYVGVRCPPLEEAVRMAEAIYAREVEPMVGQEERGSTTSSGSRPGHEHPVPAGTPCAPERLTGAGMSTAPGGKESDSRE